MVEGERSPIGDTLGVVQLGPAHIAQALQLSSEAQWNQVAADWSWMLQNGDSFGVVTAHGRLVASGLTVNFPAGGFGWISMILVTPEYRRRRLATSLMHYCVEALRRRGLVAGLDASPQGQLVYLPLGFAVSRTMTRLRGAVRLSPSASGAPVRAMTLADLPAVAAYEAVAAGTDRNGLLSHLLARRPDCAFVSEWKGAVRGCVLVRDGRTCAQVGPLVADDDDVAVALLQHACTAIRGPVCLDVGDQHPAPQRWLREQGFAEVTTFARMIQHRSTPFDDPARIYAVAGPEFG
jgi:ribosomal protein S18 acetylase RimI-like enzyme